MRCKRSFRTRRSSWGTLQSPLSATSLRFSATSLKSGRHRTQTRPSRPLPARPRRRMRTGSLTVVGTGIQAAGHLTAEARLVVEKSDEALYLVADPVTATWIERTSPNARSLALFYEEGKDRREIYVAIVE